MMLTGKIQAIKLVREAGYNVKIERNPDTGRTELVPGIGLKEAKDLVEAIMDMAVRDFIDARYAALKNNLVNQLTVGLRYEPMNRE